MLQYLPLKAEPLKPFRYGKAKQETMYLESPLAKGKQEMTRKRPGKARECPIGAQNNGKE